MSLNMDSTHYRSLQHPQSPTHRSPELAPISLTSMAESYERLHRNESTTAHQQQRQQMRTSLGSPTEVYSSNNNNDNNSSHGTTTKSHDASFTMTPSSSTSSISLFGSALSVGNEQENNLMNSNNSIIDDQHTTEHTMVSNISRNTTSSGDDDPPCTTSYDDGGNPLTLVGGDGNNENDEWHDEVISQTKQDGDMDNKELEVDRFSIMDGGEQGIWQTYRPDYLMLNDSYQATKHNMYKEIEASLGNLQQLESHVETSQLQLHGRIEEAYEAWSQQLDSQRRQLAHRHRAINDDHLDKHSLEQVTFQTKIKLNVGGDIFETSLATLKKDRSSLLATMFSGKHTMQPDQEGAYFIDRDPTHFRLVLNYLRDLRISPSVIQDKLICQELLQEAEFYRIDGLVKLLV